MTLLNGLLAEANDFKTVRFTCAKCSVATCYPIMNIGSKELNCPSCGKPWFTDGSADVDGIRKVMDGLSTLLKRDQSVGTRIRFELKAPSERTDSST